MVNISLALVLIVVVYPVQTALGEVQMKQTQTETKGETQIYVRQESVDRFEDLGLTPYWDIEMAQGETVVVDCGVYTAGQKGVSVQWIKPNGSAVESKDTDR